MDTSNVTDNKYLEDILDSTTVKEKGTYTYQYKNEHITQTLIITYIKRGRIAFDLTTSNNRIHKASHLKGIANMLDPNGDYETDDDDEGNAYSAKEYIYETGDCDLSIRVDVDSFNFVQIPNTKTFVMLPIRTVLFFL